MHYRTFDILKAFGIANHSYLNSFMDALREGKLSVIGSIIFVIFAYYLLVTTIKGNMTYGTRTASFTFHPIT